MADPSPRPYIPGVTQAIPPIAPRRRSRATRLLMSLALLQDSLAGAHGAAWFLLANSLQQGTEAWAEARRAEGWQVSHGTARRSGWPWAVRLTLPDLTIAAPVAGLRDGLGWQAGALQLALSPAHWRSLEADALGPQSLRLGTTRMPMQAGRLSASIPFRLGQPEEPEPLRLTTRQFTLGEGAESLSLAEADASLIGQALTLDLRGLTLPPGTPLTAALGRHLQSARLEAIASGPLPLLLRGGAVPSSRAATWRDAGGRFDLQRAVLQWGDVALTGSGRFELDAALQPRGEGQLQLANPVHATDALAAAGLLPARAAALARGLLPILSRPDPAGGPPRLEVPFTLRDRALNAGGIPLLRVPALAWDQG